jgi:uncharacterized protein (TIGR02246 family)
MTQTQQTDERTLRSIVSACEAAWNAGDAAGFCATMADDIDFINVVGQYYKGREDVERRHRHIFDTVYKGSRVNFAVESIRFLGTEAALVFIKARLIAKVAVSDVAAVDTAARIRDENQESHARPTMIFGKIDGSWRMVAWQNTNVGNLPTARA